MKYVYIVEKVESKDKEKTARKGRANAASERWMDRCLYINFLIRAKVGP